ncbi:Hypothetical predicted protein [Paramuricea clavata]|uniref:Uncharacterized protein n=1 Tax=Paramuricea clavata TaxID=317549 RepID=A0A6S7G5I6_PARCT|nr:Hypothetical predicted protein [Paramuricea clavata]
MISRKWYNSTGKDKSSDNLKDQNNKNVTNQNPSNKNTNVKLELKALSKKWYSKRGRLAAKNWGRSSAKEKQQVGKSNMTVIKQSTTTGSIDENIENIFEQLSRTTSRKRNSEFTGLLAVGELIKSSCVTSTQEAGKVYTTARCGQGSKKMTSYLFDYFGRYFNIVQFYLYDRSYIIENRNQKFDAVIRQLQNITADLDTSCNKKIEGKVGPIFASAIQMMDTKWDKDLLKELQKLQKTSQVVRNDMTNSQQSRLQKRIVQRRKDNEMKSRFKRRGRMMKCEEWPQLAQTLEYIFGEFDQKEKSGGGLEAHARLTNNNMYRCKDNNTFMRQALETVNSISPPSFNTSLSSCFNYTMTYKRNTACAKRHHHGKDVNANISLHNPPKTQVKNLVVNLHYSTANVNYICDDSDLNKKNVIVDSKDAKKIVCAEICPVQKPGKTWSEIEYPDHDWGQSRTNAVTPMTHLFMNTIITERERFLKSVFIFIVDNGPAEQPSSTLVQMLLIRLLITLNLDKITQVSFAEYYSKCNFVERYSVEDEALSRHGPFTAHKIFNEKYIQPGSSKHIMNMGEMAKDVATCLGQVRFGGSNLEAYRGIKQTEHVFIDEERLKQFLSLSEELKKQCEWVYRIEQDSAVWKDVEAIWNLSQEREYKYVDDYKLLTNTLTAKRTTWMDKYQVTFYRSNEQWRGDVLTRKALQPIPDYIRWVSTGGELHYMTFEKNLALKGDWDSCSGLFRPERLLDILISINSDPPDYTFPTIASFVWLTENDTRQYFKEQHEKFRYELREDLEREKWKGHKLFSKNVGCPTRNVHEKWSLGKLSTAKLRFILNYHGLPTQGTKEELCLRLFLLRQNRYKLAFKDQEDEIKRMLRVVPGIILDQRRNALLNPADVYRKRTHYTFKKDKSFLVVPNHLTLENIHNQMLKPIEEYLKILYNLRKERNTELIQTGQGSLVNFLSSSGNQSEDFMVVEKRIKIKWSKDEIGNSGWKYGWYTAMVQGFSIQHDSIDVVYFTEKDCVYTVCVSDLLSKGKLMAA